MEARYIVEGVDRYSAVKYSSGIEIPTYDLIKYIQSAGNGWYYEGVTLTIF